MPSVQARRLCPELVFVPPRFDVYRAVSMDIRAIFAEYTHLVEPLSLDEAYLDVTENLKGMPSATRIALEIRATILERTSLTASAGISYNKFLAKLASDHRKPNGQFVVTPDMGAAFIEGLEVGRFHGVGPVTARRMNDPGIMTGGDLKGRSLAFLVQHFGKAGMHFHAIARAEDDRRVEPDRPRKSAGSETTYERDLVEPREVELGVEALADEVWSWCRDAGSHGRTVTVKVRWSDFRTITRSRTLSEGAISRDILAGTAVELVRGLFPLEMSVRLLGVTVSGFEPQGDGTPGQMSFDFAPVVVGRTTPAWKPSPAARHAGPEVMGGPGTGYPRSGD